MNKAHFYLWLLGLSIFCSSCYTGPEDPATGTKQVPAFDKQRATAFVDSINAKFTEQVRNGDSVALAAHYSSDAELLFSNSEPIKGKDILSAWGSIIRMGVKEFTFSTTDITGSSDLFVETGMYEMKTADKTLIDRGKYLVVWKLENGEWKLFRDIGNTSLPAPATK